MHEATKIALEWAQKNNVLQTEINVENEKNSFTQNDLKFDIKAFNKKHIVTAAKAIAREQRKKEFASAMKEWKKQSKQTGIRFEILAYQDLKRWYCMENEK